MIAVEAVFTYSAIAVLFLLLSLEVLQHFKNELTSLKHQQAFFLYWEKTTSSTSLSAALCEVLFNWNAKQNSYMILVRLTF